MDPRDIYSARYAPIYRALYLDHPQWRDKHRYNLRVLAPLVAGANSWLDTCCGQAWHFAQYRDARARRVGIDISPAQLAEAAHSDPDAVFIEADIADYEFEPARRFDLVTNFWGALGYLDDERAIAAIVAKFVRWTAPGGTVYLELITPQSLAAFNDSAFAKLSATRTRARSPDHVRWAFDDPGGTHCLTSPSAAFFVERFAPWFDTIECADITVAMQHFIARGKKIEPDPGAAHPAVNSD